MLERAEVAQTSEPRIEGGDIGRPDRRAVVSAHDHVRRTQHRDERRPRESGQRRIHQQIESRRPGFRREWQRARRLVRNAGRPEQELRRVEIRQRTAIHQRGRRRVCRLQRLDAPCVGEHFLVAIAAADPSPLRGRDLETRLGGALPRHPHVGGGGPHPAQPREEPFGHPPCRDDVDALDAGRLREQLQVDRPQPVRIGVVIGDAHDHVRWAPRARRSAQRRAKGTFVEPIQIADTGFESPIGLLQEARLKQQALGAPIGWRLVSEACRGLVEPRRRLVAEAADLIVEAQHLGDEPGPQQERRDVDASGLTRARAHQHLTRQRRESRRVDACADVPRVVEFVAREQARQYQRAAWAGSDVMCERVLQRARRNPSLDEEALLERASPLLRRRTARHDQDGRIDGARRRWQPRWQPSAARCGRLGRRQTQQQERPLPGVEVVGLDQSDHRRHGQGLGAPGSDGGRRSVGTSVRSCCNSISAPAAAAEASQACGRSPLRIAARRACIARPASCWADTHS